MVVEYALLSIFSGTNAATVRYICTSFFSPCCVFMCLRAGEYVHGCVRAADSEQ